MKNPVRSALSVALYLFQRLSILVIGLFAIALAAYAVACAFGVAVWLTLPLSVGGQVWPQAGMAVQLGLTAVALALLVYLPAHGRMMALETSHRSFHLGMRDVARAYAAAHSADREGAFTLQSEFDSIRERIAFLRAHPDLDTLEPGVIELAAQMSHVSRELAQVYSDGNVARARDFLIQRQADVARFEERIVQAKTVMGDLGEWRRRVEAGEAAAQAELVALRAELDAILPERPVTSSPASGEEDEMHGDDGHIVALLSRRALR